LSPAQITGLRVKVLGVSQQVFAHMLNASPQTVQTWEQGRAKPSGPTLRFLRVIEDRPDVLTCA
jgi:putative transcriptional regulator